MSSKKRLTPEDWLAAGFRQLAASGPGQLKAEVLARALGTTKGSFYWHFTDLGAFKDELLKMWPDQVATEVIAEILKEPTPHGPLHALVKAASLPAPEDVGGKQIDPAMRAWAINDPKVMEVLIRIDAQRLAFVKALLDELGHDGERKSTVFYAAFLGLQDLVAKHDVDMTTAMQELIAMVLKDEAQGAP
jgi:AcrR family transcriptional regulator